MTGGEGSVCLHVYPSPMQHESRILRVTGSLAASGLCPRIDIVGMERAPLPEHERLDQSRSIWRVPLRIPRVVPKLKSATLYAEWYTRIVRRYRSQRVSVVHCHSLYDLPLGVALKRLHRGAALVYDAHELETERNGLTGRVQRLARQVERRLLPHADHILTVSPSIGAWYQERYRVPVSLVRNRPARRASAAAAPVSLRERFGIQGGLVFLYQGALIRGRGIELLIDVFARARPDRHVVFMGYGALEERVRAAAAAHPNVHFHEAVPPDILAAHSAGADVGLSLIENVCLSYYYCLPNKLYEYVAAGVPVIVSDFPDMAAEVDRLGVGWKAAVSADAVRALVDGLTPEAVAVKREAARSAAGEADWAREEPALLAAYRALPGAARS